MIFLEKNEVTQRAGYFLTQPAMEYYVNRSEELDNFQRALEENPRLLEKPQDPGFSGSTVLTFVIISFLVGIGAGHL